MLSKTGKLISPLTIFAFLAIRASCVALPSAPEAFAALRSAGPGQWAVLEVGPGTLQEKVDLSNPQGGIFGNVGTQQSGHIQDNGPQIHGDLFLGDRASAQFSGTYTNNRPVAGTIHLGTATSAGSPNYSYDTISDNPQVLLTQAHDDAIAASAVASSVPKTSTLATIDLTRATLTLAPGVYDLSKFHLDHSTLTLSGSGYFIFNITGNFQFNSGKVLLSNGAMATNVLFNVTSTHDVQFSGGTSGTDPGGPDESVLHGIILALNARIQLAPGLVVGEIISGNDISIASGAIVQNPPARSVPDGTSTLALSFIALGALVAFRSLVIRNLSFRPVPCR